MIQKNILCKRLSTAVGADLSSQFTWFFGYFCEHEHREDLRKGKRLSEEGVMAFSRFCGYDLRFPIPLPLFAEK